MKTLLPVVSLMLVLVSKVYGAASDPNERHLKALGALSDLKTEMDRIKSQYYEYDPNYEFPGIDQMENDFTEIKRTFENFETKINEAFPQQYEEYRSVVFPMIKKLSFLTEYLASGKFIGGGENESEKMARSITFYHITLRNFVGSIHEKPCLKEFFRKINESDINETTKNTIFQRSLTLFNKTREKLGLSPLQKQDLLPSAYAEDVKA
jgi:hypothetical protein